MLRLTRNKSGEKDLKQGELRPELANLLCFLSSPTSEDIFLDPFCGYGSIPFERALCSPYKTIYATDLDIEKTQYLKHRARALGLPSTVVIKSMDALSTSSLMYESVDKIDTDPPWGFFEKINDGIEVFYKRMLQEFYRVLRPEGTAVILTARKDEFDRVLDESPHPWRNTARYDILVSGKKAGVFKIEKN